MKLACSLSILALVMATLAAAQERKSPLNGKWFMTAATNNGDKETKSPLIRDLTFDGDKITLVYDRSGQGGNEKTVMGKVAFDTKAKPVRLTLSDLPSDLPAGFPTTLIVKFESEKITICYHTSGGSVPDDFKTAKDDGREIVEFAKRKE
jgi:uncharacterized protein (TIGR03067 family)